MKRAKRNGDRTWMALLAQWRGALAFLIAAGVVGGALMTGIGVVERRTGLWAEWMGWATVQGVKQEIQPIAGRLDRAFQWQLYEQIRRLSRNVDELKDKKALSRIEQERLADLLDQLSEAKAEYAALKKRAVPTAP
jgi:hypothetical protein